MQRLMVTIRNALKNWGYSHTWIGQFFFNDISNLGAPCFAENLDLFLLKTAAPKAELEVLLDGPAIYFWNNSFIIVACTISS